MFWCNRSRVIRKMLMPRWEVSLIWSIVWCKQEVIGWEYTVWSRPLWETRRQKRDWDWSQASLKGADGVLSRKRIIEKKRVCLCVYEVMCLMVPIYTVAKKKGFSGWQSHLPVDWYTGVHNGFLQCISNTHFCRLKQKVKTWNKIDGGHGNPSCIAIKKKVCLSPND